MCCTILQNVQVELLKWVKKELWISKICMSPNKEWNLRNRSCTDIDNLNKYLTFYPLSDITRLFTEYKHFHLLQQVIFFKCLEGEVWNRIRQRGCGVNLTPRWICAYRMIMNYGYEHIIIGSYIIYIEKATADLKSKCRKICIVYLHTRYFEGQNSEFWKFLKEWISFFWGLSKCKLHWVACKVN